MSHSYYAGGLAEIISQPSEITFSYLKNWFTGAHSFGRGMQLLGLPYQEIDLPLVTLVDGELMIDMNAEEKTLYSKTIFTYAKKTELHSPPHLKISVKKMFSPLCIWNSLRLISTQSKWIGRPDEMTTFAEKIIAEIPKKNSESASSTAINQVLTEEVWPAVIAVSMLAEFYHQLATRAAGADSATFQNYVAAQLSQDDWFFRSISDQQEVVTGELSFKAYLQEYGLRADRDYELTFPRWYEMPAELKKRVKSNTTTNHSDIKKTKPNSAFLAPQLAKHADTEIKMQLLRSQAKKKTLFWIDQLRKSLIAEKIINSKIVTVEKENITTQKISGNQDEKSYPEKGKGVAVSVGQTTGQTVIITTATQHIPPHSIGIFPNASPEFATVYPQCQGMIFLKGGQTSHGSIVAREFKIPALIDPTAHELPEGKHLSLNGMTGEWEVQ